MGNENRSGILKGIDEIREFINHKNPPSRKKVLEMISKGMPAALIGRSWWATEENIKFFFNKATAVNNKGIDPEKMEDTD